MKKILLIAGVSALSATQAVNAATETTDSVDYVLDEIEVTANRATSKTPVAFTNLSKKALEKNNDGKDLPFLLTMTPSVTITSDAGAGIGYSGIRVRGTDASRINVTANGIPINDAESHNVYWVNMPDLVSSLRDVQIQRGAGTSTNGAGAFGASINMVTDAPSQEAYGEFAGSYGMYNTHKETLRAGTGLLGNHWTIDARISNIGTDGYIERASSSLWSYFGQVGYLNGGTSLRLLAFGGKEDTYMAWDYASKEEMEKYGRRYNPCGKYTDSEGNTAYYPDQKDHFIQHHFQLHLSQYLSRTWRLNLSAFYTKGDGYYEQYKTNRTLVEYGLQPYVNESGETIKKSDLIRLKFNDNGFYGLTGVAYYQKERFDLSVGGAVTNFDGKHFGKVQWVRNYIGPLDPLQEYYNNTGRKFDANIYARTNVNISRMFSAFGDLQYRHINYSIKGVTDNFDYATNDLALIDINRKWDFFNPKVGIHFTDNDKHRAFASWSVAHREPVRDNFTDGDRNHDPEAERLFDYELGYTFTHKLFSVGVNLYYMDYKNQLVLTGQLSDTGNPLSVNVPHSYRAGIELQASLIPCGWFEWQINATLSRNRIKNFTEYIYEDEWTNPITQYIGSTPIAFSPDFLLNNSFNFKYKGFEATLMSHYVGKQYLSNVANDEQMLKAYFVSDLMLNYNFGKVLGLKNVRLGFAINNIFNAKYCNNGYAGAGYYVGDNGEKIIYRYAGFAAQATTNVLASINVRF